MLSVSGDYKLQVLGQAAVAHTALNTLLKVKPNALTFISPVGMTLPTKVSVPALGNIKNVAQ